MEVAMGADIEAGPTAMSKPAASRKSAAKSSVAAGPAAAAKEAPDEAMSKHGEAKGVESQTQNQRSSRSTAALVPTRTRALLQQGLMTCNTHEEQAQQIDVCTRSTFRDQAAMLHGAAWQLPPAILHVHLRLALES